MRNTGNNNSFADNISKALKGQSNIISLLTAMLKTTTENSDTISYTYEDLNGNTYTQELPTYASVEHKVSAIESSIQSLLNGKGQIKTSDGDRYDLTVSAVPQTPDPITSLSDPSTFKLDCNWFFENLMFPGAVITLDLTGQVPDNATQIQVLRVIVDSSNAIYQNYWNNNLSSNVYTYIQLIQYFEENNIVYSEDLETVSFPMVNNNYYGSFSITADPEVIDGNFWYTLDTIKYNAVSAAGIDYGNNNLLSIDDELLYSGALYEILEIDLTTNKIRVRIKTGAALPGKGGSFKLYKDPNEFKEINIRFGYNEYNFIYIKPIQPENNILANSWSPCIKFNSDDLTYAGDETVKFSDFYAANIVDWGAKILAEAKERKISAFEGKKPNAPVLVLSDYSVVNINEHLKNTLLSDDLKSQLSSITSQKSDIDSLTSLIATQKASLRNTTTLDAYKELTETISVNTTALSNKQTLYSSLIASLKTDLSSSDYITSYTPKYRVRGFFAIPDPIYYGVGNQREQEIIGFEIRYRYKTVNGNSITLQSYPITSTLNTSNSILSSDKITTNQTTSLSNTLNTNSISTEKISIFNNGDVIKLTDSSTTYKDSITTEYITTVDEAVFTDWNIITGKLKERIYDEDLGYYVWSNESVTDGSEISINQIDIPITQGETVEFQVRSISEAGYPDNPLKSDWSNSVSITFSSNTNTDTTSSELSDITDLILTDFNQSEFVKLLNQNGLIAHVSDAILSSDSLSTVNFNHLALYIAYVKTDSDTNTVTTISLQDKIDDLESKLSDLTNKYNNLVSILNSYANSKDNNNTSVVNTAYIASDDITSLDASLIYGGSNMEDDSMTLAKSNVITNAIKNLKNN